MSAPRGWCVLSVLSLTLNVFAIEANPQMAIDLRTAMESAVTHSFALKASEADKDSAEYTRSQALRSLGPNLSVSADNTWREENPSQNEFGPKDKNLSATGSLILTQPILGLVKLAHTYQRNDLAANVAQLLVSQSQTQAALTGAQLYLNTQLAMQQLSIAQANLATALKSKQDAETLLQTGSIYKDDYLSFLLQHSKAKQAEHEARSQLDLARFTLAQAIGAKDEDAMRVKNEEVSYWENQNLSLPTLAEIKKSILEGNLQLRIDKKNVELAQQNKKIAFDDYLPNLDFVVQFDHVFHAPETLGTPVPYDALSYGLRLSWNVWDWGVRQAQNSSLASLVAKQSNLAEASLQAVLTNSVTLYYQIKNNLNAIEINKEALKNAQEAYQLVSYRFLSGQVKSLDVITAQENLSTAKASLAQARFNLDSAWINFQVLRGQDPSK